MSNKTPIFYFSWQVCQPVFTNLPIWIIGFCQLANLKSESRISADLKGVQFGKMSSRKNQVGNKLAIEFLRVSSLFLSWQPDILSPTGRERTSYEDSLIPTGGSLGASGLQGVCHG